MKFNHKSTKLKKYSRAHMRSHAIHPARGRTEVEDEESKGDDDAEVDSDSLKSTRIKF